MPGKRPCPGADDLEDLSVEEIEELMSDNERLKDELDSANQLVAQLRAELAAATGVESRRRVQLVHLPNIPKGLDLEFVEPPRRFSSADAFPHAVATLPNDSRVYEVEARRRCRFTFQARFMDGSPATEYDIHPSGNVPIRMRLCFAHNPSREVSVSNFAHLKLGALVEPKSVLEETQLLVRGEVSFTFRCLFTSTDSRPASGAQFVVKVEAQGHDEMVAQSVPFVVRSKVTAPREKKDKA